MNTITSNLKVTGSIRGINTTGTFSTIARPRVARIVFQVTSTYGGLDRAHNADRETAVRARGQDTMKIRQWVGTAVVASGLVALSTLPTVASSGQRDVSPTVDRKLSIRLKQPIVVTIGDNPFEVLIEGPDGKRINDAEVAVAFVMASWPIKRIPETKTALTLRLTGDGKYTATWYVSQSGPWQTTITVKRDEVRIGRKSLILIAY